MHSLPEMSGALTTERMGRAATAALHCQRGSVLTSLTSTVSSAAQAIRQGSPSSYWRASACLTMWSVNRALASPKIFGGIFRCLWPSSGRWYSAALWFVPLWLSGVSAGQLIQEPVHHADAWAHSLVEQLRVGRAWMRPGGREFFGVLDFFSHVNELLVGDV
jgi:hypothetical protein